MAVAVGHWNLYIVFLLINHYIITVGKIVDSDILANIRFRSIRILLECTKSQGTCSFHSQSKCTVVVCKFKDIIVSHYKSTRSILIKLKKTVHINNKNQTDINTFWSPVTKVQHEQLCDWVSSSFTNYI